MEDKHYKPTRDLKDSIHPRAMRCSGRTSKNKVRRPCESLKAPFLEDGKNWCRHHAPSMVAERRQAQEEKDKGHRRSYRARMKQEKDKELLVSAMRDAYQRGSEGLFFEDEFNDESIEDILCRIYQEV